MPSAAPDPSLIEQFRADLTPLLPHAEARLGVALSGGPDSCALLLLAAAALPGRVAAITVDHGLRPEAAAEAEAAALLCAAVQVPHSVARVRVAASGKGIQAAAREARYARLAAWAREEGLAAILTGHHADDQAETLLMRLARGAGLAGLSGMRPARPLAPGILLLRPLLGWRKTELEAIVAAAGVVPARDPSNADSRYDRTAARRLLGDTPWLDPLRLAQVARNLADADAAIAWVLDDLYSKAIRRDGEEHVLASAFPHEIRRRLLLRLFAGRFGKQPDGPAVERAIAALERGETITLADILCRPGMNEWRFRPAPARRTRIRSN